MASDDILKGKKVLAVDDEPDILDTLEEVLDECDVETASTFETAKDLLESKDYDVAILDIMGVRGYDLLEATHALGIPTLMLTAHALSPDNLKKSIKLGADAYIPKDKMVDISLYVEDVLISRQDSRKNNLKWFTRLRRYFDDLFGKGWKDPEQEFWDGFYKKHAQ